LALEPNRPVTLTNLARISYAQRRYAEALRWLDSALTLDPGFLFAHSLRARVHLALGDLESARRDVETTARHGLGVPTEVYSIRALLSARMGDTAVARRRAEQLLTEVRDREHPTSEEGLGMGVAPDVPRLHRPSPQQRRGAVLRQPVRRHRRCISRGGAHGGAHRPARAAAAARGEVPRRRAALPAKRRGPTGRRACTPSGAIG